MPFYLVALFQIAGRLRFFFKFLYAEHNGSALSELMSFNLIYFSL